MGSTFSYFYHEFRSAELFAKEKLFTCDFHIQRYRTVAGKLYYVKVIVDFVQLYNL